MSLSISNNLLFVFAIFIFFGKTKKLLLQQFGKALANFYQLAILTVSARKFAPRKPLRIARAGAAVQSSSCCSVGLVQKLIQAPSSMGLNLHSATVPPTRM
jgi:hypothetical protein